MQNFGTPEAQLTPQDDLFKSYYIAAIHNYVDKRYSRFIQGPFSSKTLPLLYGYKNSYENYYVPFLHIFKKLILGILSDEKLFNNSIFMESLNAIASKNKYVFYFIFQQVLEKCLQNREQILEQNKEFLKNLDNNNTEQSNAKIKNKISDIKEIVDLIKIVEDLKRGDIEASQTISNSNDNQIVNLSQEEATVSIIDSDKPVTVKAESQNKIEEKEKEKEEKNTHQDKSKHSLNYFKEPALTEELATELAAAKKVWENVNKYQMENNKQFTKEEKEKEKQTTAKEEKEKEKEKENEKDRNTSSKQKEQVQTKKLSFENDAQGFLMFIKELLEKPQTKVRSASISNFIKKIEEFHSNSHGRLNAVVTLGRILHNIKSWENAKEILINNIHKEDLEYFNKEYAAKLFLENILQDLSNLNDQYNKPVSINVWCIKLQELLDEAQKTGAYEEAALKVGKEILHFNPYISSSSITKNILKEFSKNVAELYKSYFPESEWSKKLDMLKPTHDENDHKAFAMLLKQQLQNHTWAELKTPTSAKNILNLIILGEQFLNASKHFKFEDKTIHSWNDLKEICIQIANSEKATFKLEPTKNFFKHINENFYKHEMLARSFLDILIFDIENIEKTKEADIQKLQRKPHTPELFGFRRTVKSLTAKTGRAIESINVFDSLHIIKEALSNAKESGEYCLTLGFIGGQIYNLDPYNSSKHTPQLVEIYSSWAELYRNTFTGDQWAIKLNEKALKESDSGISRSPLRIGNPSGCFVS